MGLIDDSKRINEIDAQEERAILVGLITPQQGEAKAKEYLDELEFLAETAGAVTVRTFLQRCDGPNSTSYVGKGKLEEIVDFVENNDISLVIFDDDLTPKQIAFIEKAVKVKTLDRTSLILDIFAKRAQTASAKMQVELAQYQYLLPRLTGMWTHLERQRGGIGMRGPGETQIETDRRIVKTKISLLKEKLAQLDKQKVTQRKNRGKLTTVRKVVISNLPFLLTDTVGFIRKLPTHLVESFKSTLDEVRDSDILVHVVDISHPQFEEQIEVVNRTLQEVCDAGDKEMIMVFNKIDQFTHVPKDEDDLTPRLRENIPLEELQETWMARMGDNCVFISAKKQQNIDALKKLLYNKAKAVHTARFPYNDFLFQTYDDLEEDNNI